MTNKQILITTAAAVGLSVGVYQQANAQTCEPGYRLVEETCVRVSGTDCGTNCRWEIDEQGVLRISSTGATGSISPSWDRVNGSWRNSDSRSLITEVVVESGITNIPSEAFEYDNIKKITLPNTIRTITNYAFHSAGISEIVIPESVTSMSSFGVAFYGNNMSKIYCSSAQISNGICEQSAIKYERDGDNLVVYNSDNTIKGVYSDYVGIRDDKVIDSYEKTDPETGVVTKYNGRGQFLSSTWQDAAGSVYSFDKNGNIKGMKKRGPFTIPEADAATQGKGPFRLDITW